MKEIEINLTILRTISVPDDFTGEEIERAVYNEMSELFLGRNFVKDIGWKVIE